ncbi:MAG: C10 family peptidase [Bacteroidales bacterium]|nr:C10 family peptidase [Bacteroidales bacterium]
MKLRFSLITILFLFNTMLLANPISPWQAEQQARKTYLLIGGRSSDVVFHEIASDAGFRNLYIYVSDEGGFVILSADDCTYPVLAYSASGKFQLPMPEPVRSRIQAYDDEISFIKKHSLPPSSKKTSVSKPSKGVYEVVGPLLASAWGPVSPYSGSITELDALQCFTGSVATSMAQIMRYWNYPSVGVGQEQCEDTPFGTVSVDFSTISFDWGKMPLSLSSANSIEQKDEIAKLVYFCDASVKMPGYARNDSVDSAVYSNEIDVYDAFAAHFDYLIDEPSWLYFRDYDTEGWEESLRQEIDEGRPVLYYGGDSVYDYDSPNGRWDVLREFEHSLVCDGYDSEGLFHFNWGWGGVADGFYRVGSLQPQNGGYDENTTNTYNANVKAIMGIHPVVENLVVSAKDSIFSYFGDTLSIWIRGAAHIADDWSVSGSDDWVTFDSNMGPGEGTLSRLLVIADTNPASSPRTVRITVRQGDQQHEIRFTQLGMSSQFEIQVLSDNEDMGTVSGGGSFDEGSEIVLRAIPSDGFLFVRWQDGVTDNPRRVLVSSDSIFIAYWDTTESPEPIDTIVPPLCYDIYDTITVLSCDSYYWYDSTLLVSGFYEHAVEGVASEGCDSIYVLDLAIGHEYIDTIAAKACNSVAFRGTIYTSDTSFFDTTYTSIYGCDSSVQVVITVFPIQEDAYDTVVACDSVIFMRNVLRSNTSRNTSARDVNGCDSITHIYFDIKKSSRGACDSTVCDSLVWGGSVYSRTTRVALVTIPNAVGCDSVITVNLTVKQSTNNDSSASVCDTLLWYGDTLSASGRYYHPIDVNEVGCNINVALDLTILRSTQFDTFVTACDSFLWNGIYRYASGSYPQPLAVQNEAGCDSSIMLVLALGYTSVGDTMADVCDGILWNGTYYTEDTVTMATIVNSFGCDSVVTLSLSVRRSSSSDESATASGFYIWHGYTVTHEGETYDTLTNVVNCDSVVVLHLTLVAESKGSLSGVFAVDDNVLVSFSAGNLQYRPDSSIWRFAAHQYDIIGATNISASAEYMDWIDLFGWGASGYHNPRDPHNVHYMPFDMVSSTVAEDNSHGYGPSTSIVNADFDGVSSNYDWGIYCAIRNGGNAAGRWRTLTENEWQYLLFYRDKAVNKRALATVAGVPGVILLPESWAQPTGIRFSEGSNLGYETNVYSAAMWLSMESAGAVFLPAAGLRSESTVSMVAHNGYYWSSRHYDASDAYVFVIERSRVSVEPLDRSIGRSVRLVHDVTNGIQPCATYGDTTIAVFDSLTWFGTTYYESGDYPHLLANANAEGCDSTVVLHLTIKSPTAISTIDRSNVKVWAAPHNVIVAGAEGLPLRIYDVTGRLIASESRISTSRASFQVPAKGAYMVKVGEFGARKVIVTE